MPVWGSLYFQNGFSFVMEYLVFFHDHTMMVMVMVTVLVGYILMSALFGAGYSLVFREGHVLESVWTVVPALVLLVIAFPSLRLLYLMEEMGECDVTVKAMGHQWYWSYEYMDFSGEEFDSYMVGEGMEKMFRLLEVDSPLYLPYKVLVRVIISSLDVIHSWTVPSFGVKADAIPGRLNQVVFFLGGSGIFMGQCSEICGANHSFMPIVVKAISVSDFISKNIDFAGRK